MGKTSKVLGKAGYSLDGQSHSAGKPHKKNTRSTVAENSAFEQNEAKISSVVEEAQESNNYLSLWDERLGKAASFTDKTAESFRVLRSKILLPQDGKPAPKTIMVTSALPQEGKSFVSANLGIALAQGVDQYSLLVDCDLRVPSLAKLFGVPHESGLVDYLQEKRDIPALLRKTSMDKLSILASGMPPANPAELLGSTRMSELVEELSGRYPDRYVIFDTPPLEVASESKVLSRAVDGVVLVVRQGVSSKSIIEKFIADIGKDKIIGVIFNGQKTNFISNRLVYKKHHYYGNYYGKGKK